MINSLIILALITPWLAMLCYYDSLYRKLPNIMTLGGGIIVLVARFAIGYLPCFVDGVLGGIISGLFLIIPFLLRGAGGGDVKMIFAVGCIFGVGKVFDLLIYISFSGFFLVIFMLLVGMANGSRLKHYFRSIFDWRYDRQKGRESLPARDSESTRVPFGIAIAMGAWCVLLINIFY